MTTLCLSVVAVVAVATRMLVTEEFLQCFSFLKILGLSLPLNHCAHHKLSKRETMEIFLDSVCECVSGYVSHVIPAGRGSGKYGTSWNSPSTNRSGWVRTVKSGIVLNTPLPQRMPLVSYEEGPLHVPSGLD